jgi:dienelactone hydrolase
MGLAILAACSHACSGEDQSTVWDYLGQRADALTEGLQPLATCWDDWESQRGELLDRLRGTLGLPERAPMKATVIDRTPQEDLVFEEIAYLWAGSTYVSATVIRGGGEAIRRPAIVFPAGWKGHYTFAAYRALVGELARRGFLVLFIDDPRAGRRHAPSAGLYAIASAAGTPVAGIQVFDALRALDYLQTRPDVAPTQIGIAGIEEGAITAYLAAALEPRFQFVIAIGGTTTYRALVRASGPGHGLEDPSAFVPSLLDYADLDRIAACLAPRALLIAGDAQDAKWPTEGRAAVVKTLKHIYELCEADGNIRQVPGRIMDDGTPYIPAVISWLEEDVLPSLDSASEPPLPAGTPEAMDFSMLRCMQQQIVDQSPAREVEAGERGRLLDASQSATKWLTQMPLIGKCASPADALLESAESEGLVTERLVLGIDATYTCPAVLVRPAASGASKKPALVLSHDDRQCAAAPRIAEAARQLAKTGYWVLVPEHVSVNPQSAQSLVGDQGASFYGDDAARFYGPASVVGVTPLSLRVADMKAAVTHLAKRPEVDASKIVVAGIGLGSLDACLAAALDERVGGLAMVDATTMRCWSTDIAPDAERFFDLIPLLPGMLGNADFDILAAAVAPRPMALVRRKGGWPRNGFDAFARFTAAVYNLHQAEESLQSLGPREVVDRLESEAVQGVHQQLLLAARSVMPTPPKAGVVGTLEGLKTRRTVDSASGLIWIVEEMDGYEQQLTEDGFRLATWSFFNDNRAGQQGRVVTPVLLKKEKDAFVLTGIGKTRTNDGSGLQSFAFEPVQGTDLVGEDYFFGWHTGDTEGQANPGVIEFEDAPDALMTILTRTGPMTGQKLSLGQTYRFQSQFRRRYSVMAVSQPMTAKGEKPR